MTKLYTATPTKTFFGSTADIGRRIGVHHGTITALFRRGENEINGYIIEEVDTSKQTIQKKGSK